MLCFCSGCVTLPRTDAPPSALTVEATPVGFSEAVRVSGLDISSFRATAAETISRLNELADGGPIDVLALSGGGAGGAFGAGAIVGLTQSGTRPEFEIVTGVSTGALIAPFAFLGPDWDDALEAAYTGGASERLTARPGLGTFFRVSLFQGVVLRSLVEEFVTDELFVAVGAEARKGRLLQVATTNLDTEETVIWDMGAIAMKGGDAAKRLFVDILIASSSVPGAYPPIMINVENDDRQFEEMHVDGGVTVPFFIAPHSAFVSGEYLVGIENANVYVVINAPLTTTPRATPINTTSISLRGFSVALSYLTRTELILTASFAQQNSLNLSFTSIPPAYKFAGVFAFEAPEMRKLFDYAQSCAAAGQLWLTPEHMIGQTEQQDTTGDNQLSPTCPNP